MKHSVMALVILLLAGCATRMGARQHDLLYAENLLTVPEGAAWMLIGEWDYPGKSDGLMNYTTSIVRFNGNYIEVYSGQVVTGCCYWPQGIRLKQLAKSTFSNPVDGDTYSIKSDGSLEITKSDGTVVTAKKTAPEDSLARSWD
jgi:hypothetical protein